MSDSAWKEATEDYFGAFLSLLFPHVHEAIDWTKVPRFLDKELQNLHPKVKRGRRTIDKLAEVTLRRGRQALILIHIEVQAQVDA